MKLDFLRLRVVDVVVGVDVDDDVVVVIVISSSSSSSSSLHFSVRRES